MLRILIVFALAWGVSARPANAPAPKCADPYAAIHGRSLHAFKKHLSHTVAEADNQKFILVAKDPFSGKYALFFHVENAVLKLLNDRYFKDKELSASAISLYEQILMRRLMANPELKPDLVYSDYKTLRFAFREDSPALREHLEAAYAEAAKEFLTELRRYPALTRLYEIEGSIIRDPLEWHLAGVGKTADEAATASRFARYHLNKGKPEWIPIQDFNDPKVASELNERVHQAEAFRSELETALLALHPTSGALERMASGESILSAAAIEILRKVPADSKSDFTAYVRDGFRSRFGLELTDEQIGRLQRYFHVVETFAPSIYEAQETLSLGLEHGTSGLVATDLAGQNVRNLNAMMRALANVKHRPGRESAARKAVILTRAAQQEASLQFEQRRAKFEGALRKAGLEGKALAFAKDGLLFSGDDGVFYPRRELSEADRATLLTLLAEQAVQADDFRVTLLPGKYLGTDVAIPANLKADLIAQSETAEKALRRELEVSGVKYTRLREIGFAMDLQPRLGGNVGVRVFVTGRVDAGIVKEVSRALRLVLPKGFEAGSVEPLPPLVEGLQSKVWPRKAMRFVMVDNVGSNDAVTLPFAA